MRTLWSLYLAIIAVILTITFPREVDSSNLTSTSAYYSLHQRLLNDSHYRTDVRPLTDRSESTEVFMQLYLLSLVEVNEKAQILTTTARLEMFWQDEFLQWTPSDYGDILDTMMPQSFVWLPDVVLGNGVTTQGQLGFEELPIRITHQGYVDWHPTVLLSTSCGISITYFPFDTQECNIDFENAISRVSEVNILVSIDDPISLENFVQDGQWQVVKVGAKTLGNVNNKSKIRYTITLARRRTFYILTIMIPVFFLSLTANLIFALPPDEGEKTGTGMTVLLAFAVYLTIVADLVPNTSLQVSILGVYLTLLLGMTAIGLICCVFILRVHYRDKSGHVSTKAVRIVRLMRKFLCMSPIGCESPTSGNDVVPFCDAASRHTRDDKTSKEPPNVTSPDALPVFLDVRLTWQDVAATLDRFCFVLFSTCTILSTVLCLLSLELGSDI